MIYDTVELINHTNTGINLPFSEKYVTKSFYNQGDTYNLTLTVVYGSIEVKARLDGKHFDADFTLYSKYVVLFNESKTVLLDIDEVLTKVWLKKETEKTLIYG